MSGIAISIIVPVYNSEKFLKKGLDSCVNQTLNNIEVICIDDASTDNSNRVIQEYVHKYPDKVVSIVLSRNSRQGGARNQGIIHARGEYLCFMDSDDYLDEHLCEDAYTIAKKHDADMVFYDFMRVSSENKYPVQLIGEEEFSSWYSHVGCALWLQITRRDLILENNLFLPEKIRADDDAMVPLWKYYARKMCKINKPYYYYVHRENSLTNEIALDSIISPIINVIPYRHHIMCKKGLLDYMSAESDYLIARDICVTLKKILRLNDFLTSENIMYMKNRLKFLDGHILNKNFIKFGFSCAEIEMVESFLYHTENFCEKYKNYSSFWGNHIKNGMEYAIEENISELISCIQKKHGYNFAIWGVGERGVPIISTLIRMGYKFEVYDNRRHGCEVWEGSNQYIHSFHELCERNIEVIFVTSDFYYKAIEKQIHEKYPQIVVVNFPRMLRRLGEQIEKCVGSADFIQREKKQ